MKGRKRYGSWWGRLARLVVLALLASLACESSGDARRVTEAFYDAYGRNRMEGVWDLYAPEFFEQHPRSVWSRQLQQLRRNVGAYRSHRLVSQRMATTEEKGLAFTVLTYEVQYVKQQTTETFTIAGANGARPRIISHDVRYVPQ